MNKFFILKLIVVIYIIPFLTFSQCMQGNDAVVVNSITESGGNCTYSITYTHTVNQNGVKWVNFTFSGQQVCHRYDGSQFVVAATCNSSSGSGSNAGNNTVFTYTGNFTIPCSTTPAFSWQASTSSGNTSSCATGVTAIDYGALPITLTSFSGKEVTDGILLGWKTSEEINFSHFQIEKSSDALNFEGIALVNPSNSNQYEFTDTDPIFPFTYYRLLMQDLDGSKKYSKIISIAVDNIQDANLYPNPIHEGYFIIDGVDGNQPISLNTLTGNRINYTQTVIGNSIKIIPKTLTNQKIMIVRFTDLNGKLSTKKVLLK